MGKPNYEEFRLKNEPSRDAVEASAQLRSRQYVATGSEVADGDQQLAVYTTQPAEKRGNEVVLRLTPWSDDAGRKEGGIFDAILANSLGREVVFANAPGVMHMNFHDNGLDRAHYMLSPDQKEELKKGSFRRVGAAVMRAASDGGTDRPYILYGSSMAAALTPGALGYAQESGLHIKAVALEEGVNFARRSFGTLVMQFLAQQGDANNYLAQNPQVLRELPESPLEWTKRVVESRIANLAYVKALARGGFVDDAVDLEAFSPTDQATRWQISQGDMSPLSPPEGQRNVMEHLKQFGIEPQEVVYKGHNHPYTMTVEAVRRAVEAVL